MARELTLQIVGRHRLTGERLALQEGDREVPGLLVCARELPGAGCVGPFASSIGPVWLTPRFEGATVEELASAWPDGLPEDAVRGFVARLASCLPPKGDVDAASVIVDRSGRPIVLEVERAEAPDRGLAAIARYLLRGPLAHAPSGDDPAWLGAPHLADPPPGTGDLGGFVRAIARGEGWEPVTPEPIVLGPADDRPATAPETPPKVVNARFASLVLVLGLATGWMLATSWTPPLVELDADAEALTLRCAGLEVHGVPPLLVRARTDRCTLALSPGGPVGEVDMGAAGRYHCAEVGGGVSCKAR